MKKSYKILCLILASLMMTGCVKYEWKMSINKDKSMNYEIIVALPASMMQQADTDEMVDNEEVQSIKDAGFTVKDYSDGTMTGYTFTKKIANIDNVSSEKEVKYNLEQTMTEKNPKMFIIKKGLFKNTYTFKIDNETSDELQNEMDSFGSQDALTETDDITSIDDTVTTPNDTQDTSNTVSPTTDNTAAQGSAIGLEAMTSSMDITFNINLPYKAISSNATSTDNNGKNLKWNLLDQNLENINATFELYNMTNIYLAIGIAAAIIIIVAVIVINKIRKKKTPKENNTPVNDTPLNNIPMPQTPMKQVEPEVSQNNTQINSTLVTSNTEEINPANNTFSQNVVSQVQNQTETPSTAMTLNSDLMTNTTSPENNSNSVETLNIAPIENNPNTVETLNTDLTNNINQIYDKSQVETLDNNINPNPIESTTTPNVETLTPSQTTSPETKVETLDVNQDSIFNTSPDDKTGIN